MIHSLIDGDEAVSDVFLLSERQMERIKPFFPLVHEVPLVDCRRVLSGIVYVIRNDLQWPGLRQRGLVVSDRADLDGGDGGRAGAYLAYLSNPANGYRLASITTGALGQNFAHDIAVRV